MIICSEDCQIYIKLRPTLILIIGYFSSQKISKNYANFDKRCCRFTCNRQKLIITSSFDLNTTNNKQRMQPPIDFSVAIENSSNSC